MKVKTDYVPQSVDYITAGKHYDAEPFMGSSGLVRIVGDDGYGTIVAISGSSHTEGRPWHVVEE